MTTVEVLAIGDELVQGKTVDTNSAWLANELAAVGLWNRRVTVVGDSAEALADAMRLACERADIVIATGGLGPTEDDRSRQVAAAVAGVGIRFDEASWRDVQAVLKRYSRSRPDVPPSNVPRSNRRQAEFPEGARVLRNEWGTAPGFALEISGAVLYVLPGVPREMREMFRARVLPEIREQAEAPVVSHCLQVYGCREAELGEWLEEFMVEGGDVQVGVTASRTQITVRLVSTDSDALARTAAAIRPRLGEYLIYEGDHSLAAEVGRRLLATGTTFAAAESCTGGLLAAELTELPGISSVFLAGFVTYSNAAKQRDVGVPEGLLVEHGAVSEPVAAAMAAGAAARAGARAAVAITGVAGPDGGTEAKPVGTVCFGLHLDGETTTWRRQFGHPGRELVRQRSVREVLTRLLQSLPEKG